MKRPFYSLPLGIQSVLICIGAISLILGPEVVQPHTLITYNMAEFSDQTPGRVTKLIQRIINLSPEVVHLQEAQQQTLQALKADPDIRRQYVVVRGGPPGSLPYGGLVTLVSKTLNPRHGTYEKLPSEMDRGALSVEAQICDRQHLLLNLHLESPDLLFWRSRSKRQNQIETLKQRLKLRTSEFVMAGDFNTVHDNDIHRSFPEDWSDAWQVLQGDSPGLTFDPKTNRLASWGGLIVFAGWRIDRVLFRSAALVPVTVSRLGVGHEEPLSDHYGLMVEFKCDETRHPLQGHAAGYPDHLMMKSGSVNNSR